MSTLFSYYNGSYHNGRILTEATSNEQAVENGPGCFPGQTLIEKPPANGQAQFFCN